MVRMDCTVYLFAWSYRISTHGAYRACVSWKSVGRYCEDPGDRVKGQVIDDPKALRWSTIRGALIVLNGRGPGNFNTELSVAAVSLDKALILGVEWVVIVVDYSGRAGKVFRPYAMVLLGAERAVADSVAISGWRVTRVKLNGDRIDGHRKNILKVIHKAYSLALPSRPGSEYC